MLMTDDLFQAEPSIVFLPYPNKEVYFFLNLTQKFILHKGNRVFTPA